MLEGTACFLKILKIMFEKRKKKRYTQLFKWMGSKNHYSVKYFDLKRKEIKISVYSYNLLGEMVWFFKK